MLQAFATVANHCCKIEQEYNKRVMAARWVIVAKKSWLQGWATVAKKSWLQGWATVAKKSWLQGWATVAKKSWMQGWATVAKESWLQGWATVYLKIHSNILYLKIIGWDMTEWDPQVRSRVNRPYPGYPFLILHSHIGQHFVFFTNMRSKALKY